MEKNDILCRKKDCCGCGACKAICPHNCIDLKSDSEGFWYSYVDKDRCIGCNKCYSVCQSISRHGNTPIGMDCYAAINNNKEIRKNSSSGGFFYEIARYFIMDLHGVVYGVTLDSEFSAKTTRAVTMDEVIPMMGSKYIQADCQNVYAQIKEDLLDEAVVLFSGTPCQIAAIKGFLTNCNINSDKLFLLSIICHGVSSPMIWNEYIRDSDFKKLKKINFRDKKYGWREIYIHKEYLDREDYIDARDDAYFKAFLSNISLRPSCFNCRAKGYYQQADIIVGDFWGCEKVIDFADDNNGVSSIIINTPKGLKIVENIKNAFSMTRVNYTDILDNNICLEQSVRINGKRKSFFSYINRGASIEEALSYCEVGPLTNKFRIEYIASVYKKYTENVLKGYSIGKKLETMNFKKVGLYAISDLFECFFTDIVNYSNIELVCIADKNYKKYENTLIENYNVIGQDRLITLINNRELDAVIICNTIFCDAIVEELEARITSYNAIVTPVSLVYGMDKI